MFINKKNHSYLIIPKTHAKHIFALQLISLKNPKGLLFPHRSHLIKLISIGKPVNLLTKIS